MIRVENLSKSFANKHVLKNVSVEIGNNESFVLLGGSGTGKSVFLQLILGSLLPDKGHIIIDSKDMSRLKLEERSSWAKDIGVLFQQSALFDSLSIWQNVSFYLYTHGLYTKAECYEVSLNCLKKVGLEENIMHSLPNELSGGMQKRAALARAIAHKPRFMFCDEPTSGLDPLTSFHISKLIREVFNEYQTSGITITHDIESALIIADRIGLMHEGAIIWVGTPKELLETDNKIVKEFIHAYK